MNDSLKNLMPSKAGLALSGYFSIDPLKKNMRNFITQQQQGVRTMPKVAAMKDLTDAALRGAGIAGGALAVGAAAHGVGKLYDKFRARRMFSELCQRYPELKDNKQAREYFDLIVAYAPSLMKHPLAIGDFLRRLLQYPMSSVEFIKQLADLESTVSKTKGESTSARLGENAGRLTADLYQTWMKST